MSRTVEASDDPPSVLATGWRVNAVRSRGVETVWHGGREYLQFSVVPLTEMVLDYPERGSSEYLPAEHIRETAQAWDGVPLTYVHPDNRQGTVYDPDAFMGDVIGAFHDPEVLDNGSRLKGHGLIDVQKANDLGGEAARLVDLLQAGEQVSVSAGYATIDDEVRSGTFDGDAYDLVQGTVFPDHVAVFPSDTEVMARCSPEDGCVAPRANAYQHQAGGESGDNRHSVSQRVNGDSQNMSGSATEANDSSTELTNDDGEPLATREEFEELKAMVQDLIAQKEAAEQHDNAVSGQCGCDGACQCSHTNARTDRGSRSGRSGDGQVTQRANMSAVPGHVRRDSDDTGQAQQTEDSEEYPAGGRKAWERRQVGLDEVPDERPTGYASGRSNYERAKRKRQRVNSKGNDTSDSSDDGSFPTGTRSSHEARQNANEETERESWAASEYPHTAKRKEAEREAKRQRQQELQEIITRNEARHEHEQRQSDSE